MYFVSYKACKCSFGARCCSELSCAHTPPRPAAAKPPNGQMPGQWASICSTCTIVHYNVVHGRGRPRVERVIRGFIEWRKPYNPTPIFVSLLREAYTNTKPYMLACECWCILVVWRSSPGTLYCHCMLLRCRLLATRLLRERALPSLPSCDYAGRLGLVHSSSAVSSSSPRRE